MRSSTRLLRPSRKSSGWSSIGSLSRRTDWSSVTSFQRPRPDCNHTRDKLTSYSAAKGEVMPSVEHRRHKGLYGAIDVKVRVQRQRSSGWVRWEDGYALIRGEFAIGRGSSRRELVFGGPRGARTVMQPCASAAKLRGGGSNLNSGFQANPLFGAPPPRIIHGSSPGERR